MTGFLKDERYHDPSGAVLGGGTRHSIDFRRDGRTYEIPLERDRSYDFYIRADAAWDDGTPVSREDRDLAERCAREFCRLSGRDCSVMRADLR